jgi:hypothetical protein
MNTLRRNDSEQHKRIGFAVILLTVGFIWLLYNIDVISASGVNIALGLWPLALVALGVDLLLNPQAPRTANVIILGTAALVIVAAAVAPRMGIGVVKTTTETYNALIENAESATINLYPGVGQIDIYALDTTDMLFSAEATYIDEITFKVQGTAQRQIEFGQREMHTTRWFSTDQELRWNIGLAPTIPLNLSLNTGVGEAHLDLTGLTLSQLTLTGGVGYINLVLPNQEASYQVMVAGGVGDLNIEIPENADVDVTLGGGVGDVHIDLADNTPVRITGSHGMGHISLPEWLEHTDTVWQSDNFVDAARRVSINIQGGLGDLTIR